MTHARGATVRYRIGWLLMYALSVAVGVLVLILMYVMEARRGMLYHHPHPMQAIP